MAAPAPTRAAPATSSRVSAAEATAPSFPVRSVRSAPRSQRAVRAAATPLADDNNTPDMQQLLGLVPAASLPRSRFAVIFREPVARLLSWYNHAASDIGKHGDYASFDTYFHVVLAKKNPGTNEYKMGLYDAWMKEYHAAGRVKRSQLLVYSFEAFIKDPRAAMRALTTHYGLPRVLTRMDTLPEENTHDGPGKVIQIKCSTRAAASAAYAPANHRLYALMAADHAAGGAPPYEPPFAKFDVSALACGTAEKTMGGLTSVELLEHFNRTGRRKPSAARIANLLRNSP